MSKEKLELLESSLDVIAERAGDITPLAMSQYYRLCPEAKSVFLEHGYENTGQLEATMVDWVLYCVMTWFKHPSELIGVLAGAAPHHESLKIPFSMVLTLMEVTLDVMIEHLPEDDKEAHILWAELREELVSVLKSSALKLTWSKLGDEE